jgi:hypothetical protein
MSNSYMSLASQIFGNCTFQNMPSIISMYAGESEFLPAGCYFASLATSGVRSIWGQNPTRD